MTSRAVDDGLDLADRDQQDIPFAGDENFLVAALFRECSTKPVFGRLRNTRRLATLRMASG